MRSESNERKSPLSTRAAEILHSIVSTYIDSGEPVASRTISRCNAAQLSPASIRNIMADLSDDGYLSQPHTSAGRVPTAKAFRQYVQSLNVARHLSMEVSRLRDEIRHLDGIAARVERSSHVLTQISKGMGIAAAIPTANQILHQVELVPLADRRLMMIVVTRDRMVRDRMINVEQDMSADELASIRNYINVNFSGWTFAALQREIKARLEEERAVYDQILNRMMALVRNGLLDFGLAPTLHTEGASNLFAVDLHLTREKMGELFRTLEEKRRILDLLERFLDPSGEVGVQVGLGDIHPGMAELALVGLTVELPDGVAAKVAILGPMRMNYERLMNAVYHIGHALQANAT